jgi:transmembrane sensor
VSTSRPAAEERESRWIEAVEWHALRCSGTGLTPAEHTAWRLWWADLENRRVYAACARLHVHAQLLDPGGPAEGMRAARGNDTLAGGRARRWHRTLIGGAVLALSLGWVMLAGPSPWRAPAPLHRPSAPATVRAVYRTRSGQMRRIVLSDGSTVVLGAETDLRVSLTPQRRAVNLERGEAWFRVVHHLHWPFVVAAGGGTIRDLGTAFVVDRESGRVEVTVTQGHVEVALTNSAAVPHWKRMALVPIRLHRGERFSYGRNAESVIRAVSPRVALAWTRGELAFADEPLGDVVANLDRYVQRPIEVSPAAGRLRLTTLVMSRRISAWLGGLSRVLPVTIKRRDAAICIQLRVTQSTLHNNTCRRR